MSGSAKKREANEDSVVVPVSQDTFELVQKKSIYYFPRGKVRKLKHIFFYQVAPVSAITHHAAIIEEIRDADDQLGLIKKMMLFKDPSQPASAFRIKGLKRLERPIPHKKGTTASLQSRKYAQFKHVLAAEHVSDLFGD